MRLALTTLIAAAVALPAWAHDLWLQPAPFRIADGAMTDVSVQIGHGRDRERWAVNVARVLMLRSLGPDGRATDRLPAIRASGLTRDTPLRFDGAGTHVLVMESSHAVSELPAIRFQDYLAVEGLTPAQEHRTRTRATGQAGREIYSRRAKALMQVGPTALGAAVTRPMGMTLEITPERNPYTLRAGQPLAVRVHYQGRLLPGALVKLYDLDADEAPVATRRTDASGRASFAMPGAGNWLVNVVWTRPITGDPRGDFDTTFASLTFGTAAPARRQ